MSKQEVILCEKLESSLTNAIGNCPHDKVSFHIDEQHTHRLCLPQLNDIPALKEATEIVIGAEDVCTDTWKPWLPFGKLRQTGSYTPFITDLTWVAAW